MTSGSCATMTSIASGLLLSLAVSLPALAADKAFCEATIKCDAESRKATGLSLSKCNVAMTKCLDPSTKAEAERGPHLTNRDTRPALAPAIKPVN